jgi:hypothetical protein
MYNNEDAHPHINPFFSIKFHMRNVNKLNLQNLVIKNFQVNYFANELWAKFLRQADIAKDDLFRSYIPKWVEVAVKKAVKLGYPSQVRGQSY